MEVQARGVWHPAVFDSGAWTATWVPDLGAQPDGETVSLTARATDRAGWKAVTTRDILVDVKAPPPVDLALSYEDGGNDAITEIGTTLREPGGTLRMAGPPAAMAAAWLATAPDSPPSMPAAHQPPPGPRSFPAASARPVRRPARRRK